MKTFCSECKSYETILCFRNCFTWKCSSEIKECSLGHAALKFPEEVETRIFSKIDSAAKCENWNNFWKGSRGHQWCCLENTAEFFLPNSKNFRASSLKNWMTLLSSWNVFWKSCSGHVECGLEEHAGIFSKSFHVFNAELPKKGGKQN